MEINLLFSKADVQQEFYSQNLWGVLLSGMFFRNRALKVIFCTAGLLMAVFMLLSIFSGSFSAPRAILVAAREAVFSRSSPDLSPWDMPPAELLLRYEFKVDDTNDRQRLISLVESSLPEGNPLLGKKGTGREMRSVVTDILLAMPAGAKAQCGALGDLSELVGKLTRNDVSGCCSDYTEAFIALAAHQDVFAREIRIKNHTFAEVWSDKDKKWIWVDPLFGLTAEQNGRLLSAVELRAAELGNKNFLFQDRRKNISFGPENIYDRMKPYYEPESFSMLVMLLGNNLYAEYGFEKDIAVLPKAARQILSYLAGVKPMALVYKPS